MMAGWAGWVFGFRWVSRLECVLYGHDWTRRTEGPRLFLECVRCLARTAGIETGRAA